MNRTFWNVYAHVYDQMATSIPYQEVQQLAEKCLEVRSGERVLDVGCGTGQFLRRLADRASGAQLHGMDAASGMLRIARKRVARSAMLCEADLEAGLPYEASSMDAIACMQVLYTARDPDQLLRELRRVLRPMGRLVLVNPHTPNPEAVPDEHFRRARERGYRMDDARLAIAFRVIVAMNRLIVREVRNKRYHFWSVEELSERMVSAGFAVRRVEPSVYGGTSALILATPM